MKNLLTRFWFEFALDDDTDIPRALHVCGVTAYTYEDAINILKNKVFKDSNIPEIKRVIENVNIPDLDQKHVVINMNPPNYRGVWFPKGYG